MLKILTSQQTSGFRGKSKSRNGSQCGSHGNNISAWTEGANSMRWEERGRDSPVVNQHLPLKEDHSACVCCCVCGWLTTERPTWWRRPTAGGWKSEAAPGQRRSEPAGGVPPGRSLITRQMGFGWWWYVNDDMMTILKVLEESTQRAQREERKSWKGGEREGEISVLGVMRWGGELLKIPFHSFCMSWITFPLSVASSFRNTADEDIVCMRACVR